MTQLRLQLRSIEDVEKFRVKLQGIKIQLPGFKTFTVRQLSNDIILAEIHKRMKAENFSQKIITGTTVDKITITKKKARLIFRSEFFEEAGFDVALGREKGTAKHDIDAPEPTPERPNPHLMMIINGKKIFTKHVKDNFIPALFIVHNTIRDMRGKFEDAYDKAFNDWYISNMGGLVVAS